MKLPFRSRSAALPLLLLASFSAPIALLAQENGIIPNGKNPVDLPGIYQVRQGRDSSSNDRGGLSSRRSRQQEFS